MVTEEVVYGNRGVLGSQLLEVLNLNACRTSIISCKIGVIVSI